MAFPLELIHVIAQEHGFTVDELALKLRWQNNKNNRAKKQPMTLHMLISDESIVTEFTGYKELQTTSAIRIYSMKVKRLMQFLLAQRVGLLQKNLPYFIVGAAKFLIKELVGLMAKERHCCKFDISIMLLAH